MHVDRYWYDEGRSSNNEGGKQGSQQDKHPVSKQKKLHCKNNNKIVHLSCDRHYGQNEAHMKCYDGKFAEGQAKVWMLLTERDRNRLRHFVTEATQQKLYSKLYVCHIRKLYQWLTFGMHTSAITAMNKGHKKQWHIWYAFPTVMLAIQNGAFKPTSQWLLPICLLSIPLTVSKQHVKILNTNANWRSVHQPSHRHEWPAFKTTGMESPTPKNSHTRGGVGSQAWKTRQVDRRPLACDRTDQNGIQEGCCYRAYDGSTGTEPGQVGGWVGGWGKGKGKAGMRAWTPTSIAIRHAGSMVLRAVMRWG